MAAPIREVSFLGGLLHGYSREPSFFYIVLPDPHEGRAVQ